MESERWKRAVGAIPRVAKGIWGIGAGAYKLLWLTLVAVCIVGLCFLAYTVTHWSSSISSIVRTPIERVTGTTPIPINIPAKLNELQLKCVAYTGLSDFAGSKVRRQIDLERIMRTVVAHGAILGVDQCDVFRRQMELVLPGFGQRYYNTAFTGRKTTVEDRLFGAVEVLFTESERINALALAEKIINTPDQKFRAVTLIRPDSKIWVGVTTIDSHANQKPEELQKITDPNGPLVEFFPEGPKSDEFRFFRLKIEPEKRT